MADYDKRRWDSWVPLGGSQVLEFRKFLWSGKYLMPKGGPHNVYI